MTLVDELLLAMAKKSLVVGEASLPTHVEPSMPGQQASRLAILAVQIVVVEEELSLVIDSVIAQAQEKTTFLLQHHTRILSADARLASHI